MANDNEFLSRVINENQGQPTMYTDNVGFAYFLHSIVNNIRHVRCEQWSRGCPVVGEMRVNERNQTTILIQHVHNHYPASRYANEIEHHINDISPLLESLTNNAPPSSIMNHHAHIFDTEATSRMRYIVSPCIPDTLQNWLGTLVSEEFEEARESFCQGPLEILQDDGSTRFVGVVFANVDYLRQVNNLMRGVRTMCMSSTSQVIPMQPADIDQLFTIQIVINHVAIPIVQALLVDRQTETYCRVLQFLRNDLQLDFNFNDMLIVRSFELGLRNAIIRVLPETNNTVCCFHFIQSIIRFMRNQRLTNLFSKCRNARKILRMLMALPHLPANEISYHGNSFSIELGFRAVVDLVRTSYLQVELYPLMRYFEHDWMNMVTPQCFTVYGVQHSRNYFIESYFSSLWKLMGQNPTLHRFYDSLKTIEARARTDVLRAVGQMVPPKSHRVYKYTPIDTIIQNAWTNVERGRLNLQDFLNSVEHTSEQILIYEIGEPNFETCDPSTQILPIPLWQLRSLVLSPLRTPRPLSYTQHVLPVEVRLLNQPQRPLPPVREPISMQNRGGWRSNMNQPRATLGNQERGNTRPVTAVVQRGQNNNDRIIVETCVICTGRTATITCQPCNHKFCNQCITRLIQEDYNICPLCRGNIIQYDGYEPSN